MLMGKYVRVGGVCFRTVLFKDIHVRSDILQGCGCKLCQTRFRLDIGKDFFKGRCWNGLLKKVLESPSLGVFKECTGVTPEDIVQWWHLVILKVFSNLGDAVILLQGREKSMERIN